MKNIISKVYPDSIAEELEMEVGDKLISINGKQVKDIIDYKFLITEEFLEIDIEKSSGEVWELEIEKEYDEDLGIEFKDPIMDRARSCGNKCIFCFIDQLPKGMRETLYFKDDDSRLSFLQGNFVTLTNMKEEEIERIIKYRISPINISVHTTNSELRVKMLNNRFAGKVYEYMKRFSKAGILMNCQLVLCPGVNNGEELLKTVEDLYKLYPQVQNVAAVPIGITKFREGLYKMNIYSKEDAKKEINTISKLQEKYIKLSGTPFIRLSDEFYVTAGIDVPKKDFYGDYDQLEDGIGMIRAFRENIKNNLSELHKDIKGSFTFVTGYSAYEEISKAVNNIMEVNHKLNLNVKRIKNNFFGETITVAGLLTGKDIIEQLKEENIGKYIILPNNVLRKGYELGDYTEQILLDNCSLEQLENTLNRKIIICDYTGEDLIDLINLYGEKLN